MKFVLPIPGNLNHDPERRHKILTDRLKHLELQISELEDRKYLIQSELVAHENGRK